jgi:hypothetical protein
VRRLRKLENWHGPADGKPGVLLWLCHAGWGLALDQDMCIHILGECGFLPTGPIGLANLSEIPDGLDAKEAEKFLRENSMEIIERLRRYSEASLEPFVDPTLARSDHNRPGPISTRRRCVHVERHKRSQARFSFLIRSGRSTAALSEWRVNCPEQR